MARSGAIPADLKELGLWTLTDDYRVVLAVGRFAEDNSHQEWLMEYHGQTIRLPGDGGFGRILCIWRGIGRTGSRPRDAKRFSLH
jgi:hypothetical protein